MILTCGSDSINVQSLASVQTPKNSKALKNLRTLKTLPARQAWLQEQLPLLKADELFSWPFNQVDHELVSQKNCENLIGSVELPVGVAGPVLVHQANHSRKLLLPLATTEGALVASVSRGCKALTEAGGVTVVARQKGMTRAPVFACQDGATALQLVDWIEKQQQKLVEIAESTSGHLRCMSYQSWVVGRQVFLRGTFDPDQAMGMNMVTIAMQAVADWIVSAVPREWKVELVSLSSNMCTDKKVAAINRVLGRGYWVQAEAVLGAAVVKRVLKTSIGQLMRTHWAKNVVGSQLAGAAANMQVANVAAAMFAATGQDLAHVVDASQAMTTLEQYESGKLYAAVTVFSLPLGVVGGGTWLPAQRQARLIIGQGKEPRAVELAGAIGVAMLAAELSGLAALSTHTLAAAHARLGRTK